MICPKLHRNGQCLGMFRSRGRGTYSLRFPDCPSHHPTFSGNIRPFFGSQELDDQADYRVLSVMTERLQSPELEGLLVGPGSDNKHYHILRGRLADKRAILWGELGCLPRTDDGFLDGIADEAIA